MTEAARRERIAREASIWLARLNSRSVSTDELNAFYDWRREPENAAAYTRGEQLWHDARSLGDDRDIAAAVREALERPRLDATRRVRLSRRGLLAGGAALAAAGFAGWLIIDSPQRHSTGVGEQMLVRLDDGSRVRLNTSTRLETRITGGSREVILLAGQAYFEIRPDSRRPFRVRAGPAEIVATGTRFDVRSWEGEAPRIVLVDGRVEVATERWRQALARPGDAIIVEGSSRPGVARVDLPAATSWTSGRLTFRATPLAQAIAEMNRYSERKIELEAPELRSLEVDGMFETGDPDSFVAALTTIFPLRARRISAKRIILSRT